MTSLGLLSLPDENGFPWLSTPVKRSRNHSLSLGSIQLSLVPSACNCAASTFSFALTALCGPLAQLRLGEVDTFVRADGQQTVEVGLTPKSSGFKPWLLSTEQYCPPGHQGSAP